jgi:hypothetical protein
MTTVNILIAEAWAWRSQRRARREGQAIPPGAVRASHEPIGRPSLLFGALVAHR